MKTFQSLRGQKNTKSAKGEIVYAERSIGIARQNMPQITYADQEEFLRFAEDKGYKVHSVSVLPGELHPTQYDLNADKVKALSQKHDQLSKNLIVSKDFYILDGHHRWGAMVQYYPTKPIIVRKVETDIITLINLAKEFPKAFSKSIHEEYLTVEELKVWGTVEAVKLSDVLQEPIGWWLDRDPVKLYHGTHKDNLADIYKNGLVASGTGPDAGNVSFAVDPLTAFKYAALSGGATVFRGAEFKSLTPHDERVVLEFCVPRNILDDWMSGATDKESIHNHKLENKSHYDEAIRAGTSELDYYALTEIVLPGILPKFIKRACTK